MRTALLLCCWLACALLLRADEVELKNGSSFEGRIVAETDESVSIDVGGGVLQFAKSDVKRISRRGDAPTGEAAPPASANDLPQGLVGDLAAAVGEGGVPVKDLASRIEGRSRGDYTLDNAPPEMRKKCLDEMIEEELLFQGAMADGTFDDPRVRRRICESQLAARGMDTGIGAAKAIPDEELRAWYDMHKAELIEARRLFVRGARLIDFSTGEGDPALVERKWNEHELDDWIEKLRAAKPGDPIWAAEGWVSATEEMMGPRTFAMLKTVREGSFSNGILCSDGWIWVFRVDSREDASAAPPFEACRERVRLLAWADRRKGMEALITDELFQSALQAGLHRDSYHRAFIVQVYLEGRGKPRAEVLAEMRGRFAVQILLGE